jgi:hypothetical protein
MNLRDEIGLAFTRRQFFRDCSVGLGSIALTTMGHAEPDGATPKPDFEPKAKSVIYIHMAGGPSNLDLLDHKPKLREMHGKPCPESYTKGQLFAFIKGPAKILASPYKFARHGRSGQQVSELLPHTASVVDDLCVIRSMYTEQFNHAPAQLLLHTGSARLGRPGMGAWVSYGLGSENKNLPSFVVLISTPAGPDGGSSMWGSGFLPTIHQGVVMRSQGDPVLFLTNPPGISKDQRRESLDTINALNKLHLDAVGDPETLTRISQYEMAYRMQTSVPEVMDISKETKETLDLYGAKPGQRSFANNCLLARRLVESGVRFVQLYHWGWDHHGETKITDIRYDLPDRCRETDRPGAALVKDLKRRGLLKDTLVVWGGEFGRTPMNEARNGSTWMGRDHNQNAFTVWLAGGGVQAGLSYGETDEIGFYAVKDRVGVHDFQATILYLLGLNHEKLTYRFQGRDYRLTDVSGQVVKGIMA